MRESAQRLTIRQPRVRFVLQVDLESSSYVERETKTKRKIEMDKTKEMKFRIELKKKKMQRIVERRSWRGE